MLAILVLTQGTALAASVCRHASAPDHAAARLSHDARTASAAVAEENAGAVASKKGSAPAGASIGAPADLLTPSAPEFSVVEGETILPRAADSPALAGISLRPPLPPPLG